MAAVRWQSFRYYNIISSSTIVLSLCWPGVLLSLFLDIIWRVCVRHISFYHFWAIFIWFSLGSMVVFLCVLLGIFVLQSLFFFSFDSFFVCSLCGIDMWWTLCDTFSPVAYPWYIVYYRAFFRSFVLLKVCLFVAESVWVLGSVSLCMHFARLE